ncbi:hypothetical protein SNE40_017118 [Patella caerulea]|uniref:Coronin n=1 Tax=Patella caerulea TaxID=87958 RepID=A0AAN8P969_PATCE
MAWRFKASKYKNAVLKFPKREEMISELPVGSLGQSFGNHIKASSQYVVFNTDLSAGGNLGYLPLNTQGKQNRQNIPLIQAHVDFVTDFDFSPFDDYLLATVSQDKSIKIWLLPEEGSSDNITEPVVTLPEQDRKIENVVWNTMADGILAASTNKSVKIFDVTQSKELFELEGHKDIVQSIGWHGNGVFLATSCKDKKLRLFDSRTASVVQEGAGCPNLKETRVLCLGNRDQLITTGFNQSRSRIVQLHDTRNLSSVLDGNTFDTSTGILMPLYDSDTGMLFLAGKGDTSLRYLEVNEKDPYFVENCVERTEQIKGIAMVPKRGVDVMAGEVTRIMILAQNCIIPTPVVVPRKSYRDFHDDLFPETSTGEPSLSPQQWINGDNSQLKLMSLNPAKRPTLASGRGNVFNPTTTSVTTPVVNNTPVTNGVDTSSSKESTPDNPLTTETKPDITSPKPSSTISNSTTTNYQQDNTSSEVISSNSTNSSTDNNQGNVVEEQNVKPVKPEKPVKPSKPFTGVRQSKYRHLHGTLLHRSQNIENIRNVDRTVPGESDMFHANNVRCVVPIEGAGGLLAVIELANTGRLPDTGVAYLQHGSKVTDYVWDPFDDSRLVVCCDDAKIRVWRIPEGGLTETLMEPEFYLRGHTEKIYFARFHPMAKDLLVTSAYDMRVKFWDLSDRTEIMEITEHPDQVFCCAWSPDGKQLATVCKDGKTRIFEPRNSLNSIQVGLGPVGSRGARCGWALDGKYFYTSGFNRAGSREISLFDVEDLSTSLNHISLDTTPSILVPHYDEDSSTLFLTGRGDGQVYALEIAEERPNLFELSTTKLGGLHQAFSFQTKNKCVIKDVEFARAWRLTKTTIEPVTFTIPRVKKEYFQDDLFPDTKVTWEPVLTCSEWISGQDGVQRTMSLQPTDMKPLSEAPVAGPKPKKYESFNIETYKSDDQKKEELLDAMTNKLSLADGPLPQDLFEGVEEEEWDDY